MASLNKVSLIGNLGRDPEIKSFANGGRIAAFSVATSEIWKDKATGERKEKTEWHNVSVNNDGLVGVVERFLRKGSKVYLEGKLETRKWQDRDGNDRYTTEVVLGFNGTLVMLDGKQPGQFEAPPMGGGFVTADGKGGTYNYGAGSAPSAFDDNMDDQVPFCTSAGVF